MKKLSPKLESQMLAAIEKTAEYVNGGELPNDAIVKAAQEQGVPAGCISLLVHAYNTGRTTRQRQTGNDVWEKAADFEMADAVQVLEKLYPTKVKTASAIRHETAVSTEYAIPPTGVLGRRAALEKRAQQLDWSLGVSAPPPLPRDPREAMRKASSAADRLCKTAEESRRQAAAAMDKAAGTFNELSDYFRSPGCQPIPVVRENVMLLHGDRGTQVLDELVKVTPGLGKFALHKQAATAVSLPCTSQPYRLISRLLGELNSYNELFASYEKIAVATQQQAEVLLGPFVEPAVAGSVLAPSLSKTKEAAGPAPAPAPAAPKARGGWLDLAAKLSLITQPLGFIAKNIKPPETKQLVGQHMQQLTDPAHEGELRKVRTQSMLQDLLLNDPIISGYDPEDALNAYNEISEMAPAASDKKLLMQSLMHRRLTQGYLDPFDVDQMIRMEGGVRGNRAPLPLPAGVAADGSVL